MPEWKPYIIALAVGLIVGIERENSSANQKALGVRTFLLLSLLGALAGEFTNTWLTAIFSVFALLLIFTSYVSQFYSKTDQVHLGLTTEFAAGVVYAAGIMVHDSPILVATIGPIVALILFSKTSLHRFTQDIKPLELKAAITILLIAAVVIDLAPDATIDPWGLLKPRKFGYLVLTLATLEFSSYVLLKIVGEKKGSVAVGFLGGLVSSTAVLISSAKQSVKATDSWATYLCTVLVAQMASLLELLVIILLISQPLFISVLPPIAAGLVFNGLSLAFIYLKQISKNSALTLKSPLDWKGVFRLSIILGILLAMVSSAEHWLGHDAVFALSFLAGLFELQGISLANATLFSQGKIAIQGASFCILLAVVASLISKLSVSWFFARNKFALFLTLIFVPMVGIIFSVGYLTLR